MGNPSRSGNATREQQAVSVKEGIYLTFAALTILLAVMAHGHVDAMNALVTLVTSSIGMVVAIFAADIVSHLVVHDTIMTGPQRRHAVRAAFGSLAVIVIPVLGLLAAVLGWWTGEIAAWAAVIVVTATLVTATTLAIRRVVLPWWQRLSVLGGLAALSLVVIVVQTTAHAR